MFKKIDLLELLADTAKDYREECIESIIRNRHMNKLEARDEIRVKQRYIDAILVDFINKVANEQGVDYGLHTTDLIKKPE